MIFVILNKKFSLFDFKNLAIEAIDTINKRKKVAVVCGGTPLYIDSLLSNYEFKGEAINYDFEEKFINYSYQELKDYFYSNYSLDINDFDLSQKRRIVRAIEKVEQGAATTTTHSFSGESLILAPLFEREDVYQRIGVRLKQRWKPMIEEVSYLKTNRVVDSKRLDELGLEYRHINQLSRR